MRLFLFCVSLSSCLLWATLVQAQTTQRIAYIDSEGIMSQMPAFKKAKAEIEAAAIQYERQLGIAQEKAQQHFASVMDSVKQQIMTPRQQKAAEQRLRQAQLDLQQMASSSQRRLQEREDKVIQPIYETFNKAVAKVAKREGYTYVLDQQFLVFRTAGIDATEKVKAELGIK